MDAALLPLHVTSNLNSFVINEILLCLTCVDQHLRLCKASLNTEELSLSAKFVLDQTPEPALRKREIDRDRAACTYMYVYMYMSLFS